MDASADLNPVDNVAAKKAYVAKVSAMVDVEMDTVAREKRLKAKNLVNNEICHKIARAVAEGFDAFTYETDWLISMYVVTYLRDLGLEVSEAFRPRGAFVAKFTISNIQSWYNEQ